jgi:acyl-CoA dehydrogenase
MVETTTDLVVRARELGPEFAERADEHDSSDRFVAENYDALKAAGFFKAHVPTELGGGGTSHRDMCDAIRELAHYCGSTALAFSMHTHLIAAARWRWDHDDHGAEGLLRRAAEGSVLVSSGGSDWIESSGTLEKAEGGFRLNARKVFASGSPSGDLLVTSAIYEDPDDGPVVLHFPVSLRAEGVTVVDNWRAMGMRGTGSGEVVLKDVFVPEAAIGGRRLAGKWGPFHLVSMVAFPLIYSAYVGIAEAARNTAVERAGKRRDLPETRLSVGELENELCTAQIALASMIDLAATAKPGPDTTNEVFIRRTIAGQAAVGTVEKAMEVVGGASFFRSTGLERLFRDVQGARFHPLTEKRQLEYTGRVALGLDIE